ncbi:MAG TPA: flagellar motor switch protein FliN [Acidimicrobiales bacterium]|nr:flagellar motor switch protein FliN [Acidimicrobiales bacterium]
MTITETSAPTAGSVADRPAVEALIGDTVAALLPADDAWQVAPGAAPFPDGALHAVGARLGDHVVAIVATADMSRRVQVGPPPADDLIDALAPAFAALGDALGLGAPDDVIVVDPRAVEAERTDAALSCALLDGGSHLVTIVVTPPEPDAADAPDPVSFQPIVGSPTAGGRSSLDVLHEVQMGVTVELGRTRMPLRDILSLVPGSVIELDRPASAPVDVLVNGTLIARGEVVVIDEEFGIRITEVLGHEPPAHGSAAP